MCMVSSTMGRRLVGLRWHTIFMNYDRGRHIGRRVEAMKLGPIGMSGLRLRRRRCMRSGERRRRILQDHNIYRLLVALMMRLMSRRGLFQMAVMLSMLLIRRRGVAFGEVVQKSLGLGEAIFKSVFDAFPDDYVAWPGVFLMMRLLRGSGMVTRAGRL